jgi:hypothetical protein
MTEDEKYELATLVSELERKRQIYEAHAISAQPHDAAEGEKAMCAYYIAQTEYMEAIADLRRAQARIANRIRK